MILSLKKRAALLAGLLGWIALALISLRTTAGLASGNVTSVLGAVSLLVISALAFGSIFLALRKRQEGESVMSAIQDELAFRFCVIPMAAFAAVFAISLALS